MGSKKYKLPKCEKKTIPLDTIKQTNQYYVSEIQLKYKTNFDPESSPRIRVSKDAYKIFLQMWSCLLYTSPSPRDLSTSRMPSSA